MSGSRFEQGERIDAMVESVHALEQHVDLIEARMQDIEKATAELLVRLEPIAASMRAGSFQPLKQIVKVVEEPNK